MADRLPLNIKQTAQLYGVSTDTLRYYESVGLISPERESNSYRIYGEEEFARLNIILSMLEMNFTLGDIRDFICSHNLEKSIDLFCNELDRIDQIIGKLTLRRRKIEHCMRNMTEAVHAGWDNGPRLRQRGPRRYITIIDDYDVHWTSLPYYSILRSHELGISIDSLHSIPCFTLDYTKKTEEGLLVPTTAMLSAEVVECQDAPVIPEGTYLCRTIKGPAQLAPKAFEEMTAYMEERELVPTGELYEFWHVNEYISDDEDEYLHTLEIMVLPKEGPAS